MVNRKGNVFPSSNKSFDLEGLHLKINSDIDEIGCANPDVCYQICHSRNGCSDIAYPLLVLRLMPNGKSLICLLEENKSFTFLSNSWFNTSLYDCSFNVVLNLDF